MSHTELVNLRLRFFPPGSPMISLCATLSILWKISGTGVYLIIQVYFQGRWCKGLTPMGIFCSHNALYFFHPCFWILQGLPQIIPIPGGWMSAGTHPRRCLKSSPGRSFHCFFLRFYCLVFPPCQSGFFSMKFPRYISDWSLTVCSNNQSPAE